MKSHLKISLNISTFKILNSYFVQPVSFNSRQVPEITLIRLNYFSVDNIVWQLPVNYRTGMNLGYLAFIKLHNQNIIKIKKEKVIKCQLTVMYCLSLCSSATFIHKPASRHFLNWSISLPHDELGISHFLQISWNYCQKYIPYIDWLKWLTCNCDTTSRTYKIFLILMKCSWHQVRTFDFPTLSKVLYMFRSVMWSP